MPQDNADSTSGFGEDVRNASVQEGYPILAACLSSIDHDDRCVGAWDIVLLIDPVSLPERWRVLGEVIDELGEQLLRKSFSHT